MLRKDKEPAEEEESLMEKDKLPAIVKKAAVPNIWDSRKRRQH